MGSHGGENKINPAKAEIDSVGGVCAQPAAWHAQGVRLGGRCGVPAAGGDSCDWWARGATALLGSSCLATRNRLNNQCLWFWGTCNMVPLLWAFFHSGSQEDSSLHLSLSNASEWNGSTLWNKDGLCPAAAWAVLHFPYRVSLIKLDSGHPHPPCSVPPAAPASATSPCTGIREEEPIHHPNPKQRLSCRVVTARFVFNPLIALDLFVESFGAAEKKPRQCLVVNVLLVADSELEVGVCSRKRALKRGAFWGVQGGRGNCSALVPCPKNKPGLLVAAILCRELMGERESKDLRREIYFAMHACTHTDNHMVFHQPSL